MASLQKRSSSEVPTASPRVNNFKPKSVSLQDEKAIEREVVLEKAPPLPTLHAPIPSATARRVSGEDPPAHLMQEYLLTLSRT